MTASILVVDDESATQEVVSCALTAEGYRVATAGSGAEALRHLEAEEFHVIVSDIVMPDLDGVALLERSRMINPRAAVLLMTAYASLDTAVAALRHGAGDYLVKPFALEELRLRVRRLLQYHETLWKEQLARRPAPDTGLRLVGESEAVRGVREQIARSAATPSNVLITGESGAGKELVARAIHDASPRRDGPFVAVNCGAIPEALLESQLFGHLRGAFTSAIHANPGLFVASSQGTLFLDEIGELPLALQVKLLRVIEERHVWPVGGIRPVPVDVRIIASTNRDLAAEVAAGRFREDLFYRLNVVHLAVPPLRERRSDIPLLVEHLVARLNAKLGTACLGLEHEALRWLMNQPWRGNVRELENVLERSIVLGGGALVPLERLAPPAARSADGGSRELRGAVREFERQHVRDVLAESGADKRRAARVLGISLASLYRKLGCGNARE